MSGRVFKKIRLVGCSGVSFEHAVELAVRRAGETVHGVAWFEVVELRGGVQDDGAFEWQAVVDLAFKVDSGKTTTRKSKDTAGAPRKPKKR